MTFGLRINSHLGVPVLDTSTQTLRNIRVVELTGTGQYRTDYAVPGIYSTDILALLPPASGNPVPPVFWGDGYVTLFTGSSGVVYRLLVLAS